MESSSTTITTITTTHTDDTTQSNNEIRVSQNLTIKRLVDIGLNKLKEHHHITLIAKGKIINKAITVIEIIKRQHNDNLHQYNQIGEMTISNEQWTFVEGTNATMPAVIIHLSTTPMPKLESTSTYQPPTAST